MLLQNSAKPILESEDFESIEFDFDKKSKHIITDILSNRMYSYKARSILREYAANAQDANNVNPKLKDKRIHVKLPTFSSPFLEIRDFGLGMTHKEVAETFVKYGASTKRESNDQIGALGMGGKSFLCMAKQMVVISKTENTTTTYDCVLNEFKLPTLKVIDSSPNPNPNDTGVLIKIPIQQDDCHSFERELDLFSHWSPEPLVKNYEIPATPIAETDHVNVEGLGSIKYHIRGGDESRVTSLIIMGGVPYKTSHNEFRKTSDQDFWGPQGNFIVHVPIGAVSVTSSREALEYDEHTIKNLTAISREITNKAVNNILNKLSEFDNFLTAAKYYDGLIGNLSAPVRTELKNSKPNFKGMRLDVHLNPPTGEATLYLFTWKKTWYSGSDKEKIQKDKARGLAFADSEFYSHITEAEDENGDPRISPTVYRRAKIRLQANGELENVYVLAGTQEEIDEAKKNHDLWNNLNIESVSTIPLPKIVRQNKNGDTISAGPTGLAFKLNPFGSSKNDIFEIPEEDNLLDRNENVIYIPIHSKKPYIDTPGDWSMEDLKKDLTCYLPLLRYEMCTHTLDYSSLKESPFWVISKRLLSNPPNNWVSWHDWKKHKLQDALRNLQDLLAYSAWQELFHGYRSDEIRALGSLLRPLDELRYENKLKIINSMGSLAPLKNLIFEGDREEELKAYYNTFIEIYSMYPMLNLRNKADVINDILEPLAKSVIKSLNEKPIQRAVLHSITAGQDRYTITEPNWVQVWKTLKHLL